MTNGTHPAPTAAGAALGLRGLVAIVAALAAVRLVVAALVPLAFDEAYYWRLSRHLAGGYLDHPPMVMWLIRAGTALIGDSEWGVRVPAIIAGVLATWAVFRAAALLFDRAVAIAAALFFNLTLVAAVGTVLATPDAPAVLCASLLLVCLAKLQQGGRGHWWLAAGAAFGLGLMSKYSMLLFAFGMLAWLLIVPPMRRWLATPRPWAGGFVALAVFAPALVWNARHDFASFRFQGARLAVGGFAPGYFIELLAGQIAVATPSLFVLGAMGLVGGLRRRAAGVDPGVVLLAAMVAPFALYFGVHALHSRVDIGWLAPIYPAFAIAAALAAARMPWSGAWERIARAADRSALPVALTMAAAIYAQALFGLFPLRANDPTARNLGAGMPALAAELDRLRVRQGAALVLTEDYGLAGWLSFYLPSRPPVEEVQERLRWINEPVPDLRLFERPVLFICEAGSERGAAIGARFARSALVATLIRARGGLAVRRYDVYRLEEPRGAVFDPVVPLRRYN
jgi:4-amino-4-deoxy-L-arabinose transferase-like glycosyltransferase